MKSFGSFGFGASVGGCGGVGGGGAGGTSAGGGSNDWQQVAAWENFRKKIKCESSWSVFFPEKEETKPQLWQPR